VIVGAHVRFGGQVMGNFKDSVTSVQVAGDQIIAWFVQVFLFCHKIVGAESACCFSITQFC